MKILLGIGLLFLVIGTVSAFEIKDLKVLNDYSKFDGNGYSNYTTNSHRYFCVEKLVDLDDSVKQEWFTNNTTLKYKCNPVGDNIYYFEDETFNLYGYQEVVNSDGNYYMVSINQDSKLSPGETELYLKDLKEFNKLNNLEPVSVT